MSLLLLVLWVLILFLIQNITATNAAITMITATCALVISGCELIKGVAVELGEAEGVGVIVGVGVEVIVGAGVLMGVGVDA